MSHEVENMFYVGETPWHGLGTPIPAGKKLSIEEGIVEAGQNWEVGLAPLCVAIGIHAIGQILLRNELSDSPLIEKLMEASLERLAHTIGLSKILMPLSFLNRFWKQKKPNFIRLVLSVGELKFGFWHN
jgi:hypothetical protein